MAVSAAVVGALAALALLGGSSSVPSGSTRFESSYDVRPVEAAELRFALEQLGEDRAGVTVGTKSIYQQRAYRPIWFSEEQRGEEALRLSELLHRCPSTSPFPGDARPEKIYAVLRWLPRSRVQPSTLTYLEHSFSRAYLACLIGAGSAGQVKASAFGWSVEQPAIQDPVDTFAQLLEDGLAPSELADGLDRVLPPHPQVRRLAAAVTRYRAIVEAGGWPAVTSGPAVEPGSLVDAEWYLLLVRRLEVEGYLESVPTVPSGASQVLYEAPLTDAVSRFQASHGLDSDAKVGPRTVAALRVPASQRLQTLEVNFHRAGWLPEPSAEGREVWINLPAARLEVLERGETILGMRVVVGKRSWATPIFQDRIQYVVVHPAWNVPASIVADEVAGQLQRDPEKMERQGYEVYSDWRAGQRLDVYEIDWDEIDVESIHVRQAPGAANPLGRIKFAMSNDNNIYLHDTSARGLFGRSERSLSHGCIRVEKPIELAAALFPQDFPVIREGLHRGRRKTIDVTEEAPVHIVYLTAWVGGDGTAEFYPDVYQRDDRLGRRVADLSVTRPLTDA